MAGGTTIAWRTSGSSVRTAPRRSTPIAGAIHPGRVANASTAARPSARRPPHSCIARAYAPLGMDAAYDASERLIQTAERSSALPTRCFCTRSEKWATARLAGSTAYLTTPSESGCAGTRTSEQRRSAGQRLPHGDRGTCSIPVPRSSLRDRELSVLPLLRHPSGFRALLLRRSARWHDAQYPHRLQAQREPFASVG
jgi:hypothetical protein